MADPPSSFPMTRRALITAALAAAAPKPVLAAKPRVVTVLGDSITAGYGLVQRDSLPVQLQLELRRLGADVVVRGAGVSGDTSADGAARVDFSVQADTRVVVVALGGNDLLQGLDPKVTSDSLERIVARLQARHIGVVVAGLRAPSAMGRRYAREFDNVFPAVARKFQVALYPDLLANVARNPALKQSDGIHPNAKGVKIIAAGLAPTVVKALRAA
ncbi:MAG: arylesterase [Phenylobacterium sp.]